MGDGFLGDNGLGDEDGKRSGPVLLDVQRAVRETGGGGAVTDGGLHGGLVGPDRVLDGELSRSGCGVEVRGEGGVGGAVPTVARV